MLPLHPVVLVLQPPQSGTHSHLAFATLPLPIFSVVFLKLTASSRPSAPPSGSPKCLRFGHWLTLCTLNIHLLTYLLTINDATARSLTGVAMAKESCGLTRTDGVRPDGQTLITPWQAGKPLTWDVTVVSTLSDSYVHLSPQSAARRE